MFYSPVYLKKTGRFGLIWLAATQTKILSRRELSVIDVSSLCSDIFTHIPGMKEKGSRSSRFSLYLCCQLMFGSVKVLQKQWEFLLVDVQSLCKRCTDTPSSTKDIDMASTRQAVCIESNVPRDAGVNLDPYFGAHKDATIDVESMLTYLESLTENRVLRLEPLPMSVQPELGSPHSVSDPKQIQICERATAALSPIVVQIPGEQDLPKMDMESFLSISRDDSLLEIQEQLGVVDVTGKRCEEQAGHDGMIPEQPTVTEGMLETVDGHVSMMREILMDGLARTDISIEQRPPSWQEETPMTKPTAGMPAPPHKPRLDRPKRLRDPSKNASRFQDICSDELQADHKTANIPGREQTSSDESYLQRKQREKEKEDGSKGHGHDWAQKNAPAIDLPQLPATASPLRRKRPHKLVIDDCLMISRPELRQHMANTSDIIMRLELPVSSKNKNIYREPGHQYLKGDSFIKLFTRNLRFGLRTDDTGSEPDSLPSPRLSAFLSRKRARGAEEAETPAKKVPRRLSEVASMEKARDLTIGNLSESLDRNLSHSLIAQASDDSTHKARSRGHLSLPSDQDISKDGSILERDLSINLGGVLKTWPEEQEINVSPIRHISEIPAQNVEGVVRASISDAPAGLTTTTTAEVVETEKSSPQTEPPSLADSADTPRTTVYKLVEKNLRSSNDWTTFLAICPPTSYNRKIAASMFNALCAQIARGKLCSRQDEPYTSIFIWVPEYTSGLSGSPE